MICVCDKSALFPRCIKNPDYCVKVINFTQLELNLDIDLNETTISEKFGGREPNG